MNGRLSLVDRWIDFLFRIDFAFYFAETELGFWLCEFCHVNIHQDFECRKLCWITLGLR